MTIDGLDLTNITTDGLIRELATRGTYAAERQVQHVGGLLLSGEVAKTLAATAVVTVEPWTRVMVMMEMADLLEGFNPKLPLSEFVLMIRETGRQRAAELIKEGLEP
jgi:hypothetical protein